MDLLAQITQVLADGQGENPVILPTAEQSGGLFAQMVVVTGKSGTHVGALTDRLLRTLKPLGVKRSNVEISADKNWSLVDCGSIIVHIMLKETRAHYQIEALWDFESPLPATPPPDKQ